MKIRQGFVSNSSTSSFCIIGRKLTHVNKFCRGKDYVAIDDQANFFHDDGLGIISISDQEFQELLNSHPEYLAHLNKWYTLYEVIYDFNDLGVAKLNKSCLLAMLTALNVDRDAAKADYADDVLEIRYGDCTINAPYTAADFKCYYKDLEDDER